MSLKERRVQEQLFNLVLEESHAPDKSLDPLLLMLRKLREGITAADLYDDFTIKVYEKSVDICLLAQNESELFKSLTQLLKIVYPRALAHGSINLPRRDQMCGYYLLYLACQTQSTDQKTRMSALELVQFYTCLDRSMTLSEPVVYALKVFRALVYDLDFVHLSALWKKGSTHQKSLFKVRSF